MKLKRFSKFVADQISTFLFYPYAELRNACFPDRRLRVLVYHAVGKIHKDSQLEEWTVSSERFREQMSFLKNSKHNIMTVDEAAVYLKEGRKFPKRSVCITFDDGYYNNYTDAYPVLSELGIKASFYLATGNIESGEPFGWVKNAAGMAEGSDGEKCYRHPMGWKHVRQMADGGMEFASHSHSHIDLSKLDDEAIHRELSESRRLLNHNLNSASKSFCCPFGVSGAAKRRLKDTLSESDYSSAILGDYGAVTKNTCRYNLPRISVYGNDSLFVFKKKIRGAYDWLRWPYSMMKFMRGVI